MLVAGCAPPALSTSSSSRHQDFPFAYPSAVQQQPQAQQLQQLDLALEGRSIPLQQRAATHPGAPTPHPHPQLPRPQPATAANTFSPLQLQLRIDLHSEQGVDVPGRARPAHAAAPGFAAPASATAAAPLTRRQRAQQRRRLDQQKPAEEVVFQRSTATRPRTPATCPRTPLAMSTMSMPAAGQTFAADDSAVFGSAEKASAAVERLLGKTATSVVEEHRVTSSSTKTSSATIDYLQDSFDFLHQRHMKNLSDVIARHQRQQQLPAAGQGEQVQMGQQQQQQQQRHKKQVHIHHSAFSDGQSGLGHTQNNMQTTFKSTKSINLSNNNSSSSSVDLDDAKLLQQQQQQLQQRRCVRENSTSSLQSQSSVSSARSESFDNCNNNFCDAVSAVSNKSNTTKLSSSSSTTSSSTTRVQQSFTSKKQVLKQSFSSNSSQDSDDRVGIDALLATASPPPPSEFAKKVKQTTKVSSSTSTMSSSSDQPDQVECKQSVKTFKAKTVQKSVSDGRQVRTDVDNYSETAEEEAEATGDGEGSPLKPVITFSHVSSEGSHQSFTDNIVRFDFDSAALSSSTRSPSRSRSPSPLLEMPAPYNDLSKEIKRPPMEKA